VTLTDTLLPRRRTCTSESDYESAEDGTMLNAQQDSDDEDQAADTVGLPVRQLPARDAKNHGLDQRRAQMSLNLTHSPQWILPKSMQEAMQDPLWVDSMMEELTAIKTKNCYVLVDEVPAGAKVLGTRMVCKIKTDEFNNPCRLKSRFVIQGFSQRPGFDYNSSYAPVVSTVTLRMLLAIATIRKWKIFQFDVRTAYLNGNLDKPVYVRIPEILRPLIERIERKQNISMLWAVLKGLYGLKNAARIWNKHFSAILRKFGLQQAHYDPCLFYGKRKGYFIFVLIHVDDGINFTNSKEFYDELLAHLKAEQIQISAAGDVSKVLGLEVHYDYDNQTLSLSQSHYINDKVIEFGLEDARVKASPSFPPLSRPSSPHQGSQYPHLVGSLQYAASQTRPDISYSVGALARFNVSNNTTHWTAATNVLRYLKGTANIGIVYDGKDCEIELEVYVDSDHGTDAVDRKSISGYLIKMAGGPIAWSSSKQTCVTFSSAEAELVALSQASRTVTWLTKLLREIGLPLKTPVVIREDNESTLAVAHSEGVNQRSKHIDINMFNTGRLKPSVIQK